MRRQHGRLTAREEEFVKLIVQDGYSLVGAYRLAYPPRNGQRSPGSERVAARRVAHRPVVDERMEKLRNQLRAGDPVEMRRRANAVLGGILAQQVDPKYRRTALDVLRYLDARERDAARSEREALRTALDQLALLDAIEGGKRPGRAQARREVTEMRQETVPAGAEDGPRIEPDQRSAESEADEKRRRAEIDEVIATRRRIRVGVAT